jgi:hypothetical protein
MTRATLNVALAFIEYGQIRRCLAPMVRPGIVSRLELDEDPANTAELPSKSVRLLQTLSILNYWNLVLVIQAQLIWHSPYSVV